PASVSSVAVYFFFVSMHIGGACSKLVVRCDEPSSAGHCVSPLAESALEEPPEALLEESPEPSDPEPHPARTSTAAAATGARRRRVMDVSLRRSAGPTVAGAAS